MKILFLTSQLDIGGIERNLVRLTRGLVSRGHEVIAATKGGVLVPELTEAGGHHVRFEMGSSPSSIARDVKRLRRVVRETHPDVIHIFSARSATINWLLKLSGGMRPRRTRPVVISTIMGLQASPTEASTRVLTRAFMTSLGADRLVVMAPAIRKVVDRLPISRQRVVEMSVVGIDPLPFVDDFERARARETLGVPLDARVILTIGRLDPSKSHELFIRSAPRVTASHPKARFVVVGGGPLRERLENEIQDLGMDSFVTLLGERLDAMSLLAAADIYVRPGVVEGFIGITVLEAQMRGVPVVSFETEDVKLAIEDGRTGILVKEANPSALAAALLELLENPDQTKRLATEGAVAARQNFSIDNVIGQIEGLYRSTRRALVPAVR